MKPQGEEASPPRSHRERWSGRSSRRIRFRSPQFGAPGVGLEWVRVSRSRESFQASACPTPTAAPDVAPWKVVVAHPPSVARSWLQEPTDPSLAHERIRRSVTNMSFMNVFSITAGITLPADVFVQRRRRHLSSGQAFAGISRE